MSNAGLSRVASALAYEMDAGRGKPLREPPGANSTPWSQDYGQGRRTPDVGAQTLHGGGSWHSDGAGGDLGQGRVVHAWSFPGQALWRTMMAALCPGTRVFVVCLAIATFIVVV